MPTWFAGSCASPPFCANWNAPPTVTYSLPSGPNSARDAEIPAPTIPSATNMSRTSVSAPPSSRPRASATVAPSLPSRSMAFEYVR